MGFTYLKPSFFKSNGEIDRKAECDAVFLQDELQKHYLTSFSVQKFSENTSSSIPRLSLLYCSSLCPSYTSIKNY